MYAVTRSVASSSGSPSVASCTMPRHCELVVEIRHRAIRLLYQSMAHHSPRGPQGRWSPSASARVAGAGAYGYSYERHELGVTRATVPVAGLPPALAGLRIGLLTDVHRSRWVSHEDVAHAVTALMAEQPGSHRPRRRLRHLGRPAVRRAVRRSARAAVGAARRLRHPRQPRRRPRHAGGARQRGVQMLKDARTRVTIRNEVLELDGIR